MPLLTSQLQPLNDLLKSNRAWTWDKSQEEAFAKVKDMLVVTPILAYYDAKKSPVINADASNYRIGSSLLQEHDGKMVPVTFCSCALTSAEQKYAPIEKGICLVL